ncbi:hypothetical protein [Legionella clemsonensis]|uniref:Coiled-coil protein n=1 Tax=Legionella clemsonensis TaxID=1867846 RepID=A0A222P604_9GAMM|nr:hypothetical protein [Legionella clemsonensis]ASQ47290.1 hypothetical protein clem_13815 [Legionella clemsonensis]
MTAVLRRLQSQIGYAIEKKIGQTLPQWGYSHFLAKQSAGYFEPLVRHHSVLNFEYSVFCTKLANDILAIEHNSTPNLTNEALVERIATALILSELLAHLYRYYLTVPREVARLEAEQAIFRNWLKKGYFRFSQPQTESATPGFFAQKVREKTAEINWVRLFAIRTRRVITTAILIPTVRDLKYFYQFVTYLDQFARPTIAYFSWLFYIPRLTVNLLLLLKHCIPGYWMNNEEKKLSLLTRLQAQLQRRWFELGNDSVWLVGSLFNCFVFTGTLAPIGMYLAVALALFDALWVGLRAYIELSRLKELEHYYRKKEAEFNANEHPQEELDELKEYRQQLQQYIDFEWQRLLLNVTSVICLFFAMCLAIPLITNPVITFIGAALVIAITIIIYLNVQVLEKQRPVNPIMKLAAPQYTELLKNRGFFKMEDTLASPNQTSQSDLRLEDSLSLTILNLTC